MRTSAFLFLIFWVVMTSAVSAQYISSKADQAGNPVVYPGNTLQSILRIEVEIGPNPVTLTNMEFNTNGSTSPVQDILRFKLYYHNDSSSFNIGMATLIGTYQNPWLTNYMFLTVPNFNYSGMSSFSGLSTGKNYFWLLYDLSSGATVCNYIDAEFINCAANGPNYLPIVQSPAGNSIIGPCPIGISENTTDPVFSIFPVPASDEINLEFDKPVLNPISIELFDITGKKISTLFEGIPENSNSGLNFSIMEYDAGIYMIRATADDAVSLNKFVKL